MKENLSPTVKALPILTTATTRSLLRRANRLTFPKRNRCSSNAARLATASLCQFAGLQNSQRHLLMAYVCDVAYKAYIDGYSHGLRDERERLDEPK